MLVIVTNPIDNTDVEVDLSIQLNISVTDGVKTLHVSAIGSTEV